MSQTFADFELLIADDQSTDLSADIISRYQAQDSRIIAWRNQDRKGLFANYNECISRASGRYIKPFAQDDLLDPTALEKMVGLLNENNDVALVSCAKRWIDDSGTTIQEVTQFPEDRIIGWRDIIEFNLIRLTNWVGEPATVMFRREFMGSGFDTRFFHYGDIEYWFRIIGNRNFGFISDTLCSFRRHTDSATSKNLSGLLTVLDVLHISNRYANVLREFGETPEHTDRRIIELLAMQLDHLVRVENLTIHGVLNVPIPASIHRSTRLFGDPREKLYWTLRELTQVLAEIDDLKCGREAERKHLQNQIDDLVQSTSWKITGPMRFMLRTGTKRTQTDRRTDFEFDGSVYSQPIRRNKDLSGFDMAAEMAGNYLSQKIEELTALRQHWKQERLHLERTLQEHKTSASWVLSAPLRHLSKHLGA